jgi:hypothetical protein
MVDGLCAKLADCLIALTATEPVTSDDAPGHPA